MRDISKGQIYKIIMAKFNNFGENGHGCCNAAPQRMYMYTLSEHQKLNVMQIPVNDFLWIILLPKELLVYKNGKRNNYTYHHIYRLMNQNSFMTVIQIILIRLNRSSHFESETFLNSDRDV